MQTSTVKMFLLIGWFLCLTLIAGAYLVAYFLPPGGVRPALTSIMASLGAVVGLIAPHLTVAYDLVLRPDKGDEVAVPKNRAMVMMTMCSVYWGAIVSLVWGAVVYRVFSTSPNGLGVEAATSVIVGVAGLFSFLAVRPATYLSSSPQ